MTKEEAQKRLEEEYPEDFISLSKEASEEINTIWANFMENIRIKKGLNQTADSLNDANKEALEKLESEYPEFLPDAQELSKAGKDLAELLSTLESFY